MNPDFLLYGLLTSLVGPLLAALTLVFGRTERWREVGRGLMLASFAFGTVLSMSLALGAADSVVVTEVFGRAQPLFFGMSIAFDRFAALFTSLIAFATVVALWRANGTTASLSNNSLGGHESASLNVDGVVVVPLAPKVVSYLATAMLGWAAILVTVSSNVIGFMFAWLIMAWCIAQLTDLVHKLRMQAVLLIAAMTLMMGWFLLTGGGLFNDFQTIAFYANGLEGVTMPVALALMVTGTLVTALAAAKNDRVYVVTLVTVVYALLRIALFAVPVMYASVGVGLAVTAWTAAILWRRNIGKSQMLFLIGLCGAVMLGVKLESWVFMNLVLFATVLSLISTVITTLGREYLTEKLGHLRGIAHVLPWASLCGAALALCSSALLATVPFAGLWMILHGASQGMSGFTAQSGFIGALAITMLVSTVLAASATVESLKWFSTYFLGPAQERQEAPRELSWRAGWPVYVTTSAALGMAVLAPSLLVAMGAEVITSDAGSFRAAITAGNGSLHIPMILVAVAVAALCVTGLRLLLATRVNEEHATMPEVEEGEMVFGRGLKWVTLRARPLCRKVCSLPLGTKLCALWSAVCSRCPHVPRRPHVEYAVLVVVTLVLMLIAFV